MPSYGTMRKNVISQPYSRVQDFFDQQVGEIKPSSLAISYHLKSILVGNQRNMTTSTTFVHGFANKTPPTKKKKDPRLRRENPKTKKEIHSQTVRKNSCFVISCIFQQYVDFRRTLVTPSVFRQASSKG